MILINDIIKEGHPTLRLIAEEVKEPFSEEDKKLARELLQHVKNSQHPELSEQYNLRPSVGLAAPQINVSKKIIGVFTPDEQGKVLYSFALINPKIVSHSEEMTYLQTGEGCLSVDRVVEGFVPRYRRITVEGYRVDDELNVEKIRLRLRDYVAVVFQHEIDHLNGILFFDRIDKKEPLKPIPNATPIIFE